MMNNYDDLKKYEADYLSTTFVPFPNPHQAVEAITETLAYTVSDVADQFLDEVIELLLIEKEKRKLIE